MSDNLDNIVLPVGIWVNLYEATGITSGVILIVHNIGSSDVYLSESITEPSLDLDSYQVIKTSNIPMINEGKTSWAFSPHQQAKISVQPL